MTCEMDPRTPTPDARQAAEAVVEAYERRVSTDLLERDWLVDQIAAYADARVAAVTEAAITAMEQADATLVEINPGNYDDADVAQQNDSAIEASFILREAIGALQRGAMPDTPTRPALTADVRTQAEGLCPVCDHRADWHVETGCLAETDITLRRCGCLAVTDSTPPRPALTAEQRATLRRRLAPPEGEPRVPPTPEEVLALLNTCDVLEARLAEAEREAEAADRMLRYARASGDECATEVLALRERADQAEARLREAADTCPVCAHVRDHRVDCGCVRCDRRVLVEERRAVLASWQTERERAEQLAARLAAAERARDEACDDLGACEAERYRLDMAATSLLSVARRGTDGESYEVPAWAIESLRAAIGPAPADAARGGSGPSPAPLDVNT